MADKQKQSESPPRKDDPGKVPQQAQKKEVKTRTSEDSGRGTSTGTEGRSLVSTPRTSDSTSGIELSERLAGRTARPPPEVKIDPPAGPSGATATGRSPRKSPFKTIAKGVSKVIRKLSPSRPGHSGETSKSPKRTEEGAVGGKSPLKTAKSIWKTSPPKKHSAAGEDADEPFMQGDELKESSSEERLAAKSPREYGASPKRHLKERRSPKRSPKKDNVPYKRLESETTEDESGDAAEKKRDKYARGPQIGEWGSPRLTVDTDWSRTTVDTDSPFERATFDFSEIEVQTAGYRIARSLGFSESEKGASCQEILKEREAAEAAGGGSSGRRPTMKRQMAVQSPEEQEKEGLPRPSPSERPFLKRQKSEEILETDTSESQGKDKSEDDSSSD